MLYKGNTFLYEYRYIDFRQSPSTAERSIGILGNMFHHYIFNLVQGFQYDLISYIHRTIKLQIATRTSCSTLQPNRLMNERNEISH